MKCLEKKVHSYVTKSLKPSGECAEVQHTLYLAFQLPLVFIVIISCQSHLKASSSYCALKFTWEIVSFLGTHEQKIFLVLAVFILSSYFLDNMVWYRILSLKYYLKEIEMIALIVSYCLMLSLIHWLIFSSSVCNQFLVFNQFPEKSLECFSSLGLKLCMCRPFFIHSFGQFWILWIWRTMSCHSLGGKFPFIIYLIDFFHLLVSFTLLLNMFYLINTSIFNLLSDSSHVIFKFFFSSALWVSSILLDRSLIWLF